MEILLSGYISIEYYILKLCSSIFWGGKGHIDSHVCGGLIPRPGMIVWMWTGGYKCSPGYCWGTVLVCPCMQ